MPYFFAVSDCFTIDKGGQSISLEYVMLRVFGILLSEIIYSFAYVKGLIFSHISAYNTLKNFKNISAGKIWKNQPLGKYREPWYRTYKKRYLQKILI